MNLLLLTDSYKVSHHKQYPPGTRTVFSFLESRGGKYPTTTFFGLQYLLRKYLGGKVVTAEKIAEAEAFFAAHFGNTDLFNRAGWQHILDKHEGRLPIRIRAVGEGCTVPVGNVLMTVENTDPAVPWLTNYLETLLCQVWYPTTVCTQSREMKRTLIEALERTGDPSLVDFKLHDFGFRGSTSVESSALGGAAHLVNFKGTDTMSALVLLKDYYGEEMAGFSIPAAEHSTITSWGKENEADAYLNMIRQFPDGLVAVVSDSYDIYNACRKIWGEQLKSAVGNRNGVLVIRPDSGNPPEVVVNVLEILGTQFGYHPNKKGFKVLYDKVRVIQGDGVDAEMLKTVLDAMEAKGWSADNIAFGSGGGLLQKVNRDTQRFAFKCSAIENGHGWQPVMKDPVTDPGKRSKAGRLALISKDGKWQTVQTDGNMYDGNLLNIVFEDGAITRTQTLDEIRNRASY